VKPFTCIVRSMTKRVEAKEKHGIKPERSKTETVDRPETHDKEERWQMAVTRGTCKAKITAKTHQSLD